MIASCSALRDIERWRISGLAFFESFPHITPLSSGYLLQQKSRPTGLSLIITLSSS